MLLWPDLPENVFTRICIRWSVGVRTEDGPCWDWLGATSGFGTGAGRGYGRVWWKAPEEKRPRRHQAHRVLFRLFGGAIPEHHVLDHVRCQNRRCVNPYHVEPVTNKVNTQRGRGSLYQFRVNPQDEVPF